MKLINFMKNSRAHLGIKQNDEIVDITAASENFKNSKIFTPEYFYSAGFDAVSELKSIYEKAKNHIEFIVEKEFNYAPAVTEPQKIICIGLNYRKHAAETGMKIPEYPVVFGKYNNALSGHGDVIGIPSSVRQIDYEAELAVIIGRECKSVKKEDALSYVIGYTCGNDISAREAQMLTSQWMLGKSSDGFCPLGPCVVTSDEIGDPQNLSISSTLNGEIRQNSNTSDMIFTVAEIIAHLSQYWTLVPGDVILTGTPEGVILGKKEKIWMKKGDEITIEIERIGALTSRIG
jgi:2-keto-4-pentenoate hydratase/2-oxohepta-3-ene-1,7-dioic acid hydratase in catechol pathway